MVLVKPKAEQHYPSLLPETRCACGAPGFSISVFASYLVKNLLVQNVLRAQGLFTNDHFDGLTV